jgi:hypothetical protein
VQRYAEREQLTQALAYAATLQDRGWACLFVGASFLILRAREDGVFARLQRPHAIDLGILGQIRERTGIARLLVEPAIAGDMVAADGTRCAWWFDPDTPESTVPFETLGWRPSTGGIAHGKTLVVDLAQPLADIVASFGTAARRNVRKAERATTVSYGVRRFDEVSERDLVELRALYEAFLAERPHLPDEWAFRSRLGEHFRRRGFYVTAHDAGGLLGVVCLLVHDRVAHYHAAWSRPEARAARVPTGLVVAAMRLAQAQGCDLWDFVGIQDERTPARNPKWIGFTEFKLRFGGVPIWLPPAYEA